MNDTNPMDDLLDQISQFLKIAQDCSLKTFRGDQLPNDLGEKLEKLEKKVENFKQTSNEIVTLSNLSKTEVQKRIDGADNEISEESQDLINKAKKLLLQAETLKEHAEKGLKPPPEKEKNIEDPKFGKHRRKKFNQLGSNKKWKPL